MKAYGFNNSYLNGIDNGIQWGHAAVQLVRKYTNPRNGWEGELVERVISWADFDPTVNIKTPGDDDAMQEVLRHMLDGADQEGYPWTYFVEPGMKDLMTSIVVIVPEKLYNPTLNEDGTAVEPLTEWELKLRDFIKNSRWAR